MHLRDIWYFAGPAETLKRGDIRRVEILGEPILIGRDHAGQVFGFRDLCPHRGVPLSAGRCLTADTGSVVECPYHGWRFGPDGGCQHIPSLVPGKDAMDPTKIRVRPYAVRERQSNVWVYVPEEEKAAAAQRQGAPALEEGDPPELPGIGDWKAKTRKTMTFHCHVDHAVIGLMDPAHGPFVHKSWFWRSEASIHAKEKMFAPSPLGFTMRSHKPSKNSFVYKLLGGDVKTEIAFRLPGVRTEHITAGKYTILGLTTVTPVHANETEVVQTFYWDQPLLSVLKPFLTPFVHVFLKQDRDMVDLQQEGLKFNPRLMLIDDADRQAKWYFALKKEWEAHKAEARAFANPVTEGLLHWRS